MSNPIDCQCRSRGAVQLGQSADVSFADELRAFHDSAIDRSREKGLRPAIGNHDRFSVPALWRPEYEAVAMAGGCGCPTGDLPDPPRWEGEVPVTFVRAPVDTAHRAMTCEDDVYVDPKTLRVSLPFRSVSFEGYSGSIPSLKLRARGTDSRQFVVNQAEKRIDILDVDGKKIGSVGEGTFPSGIGGIDIRGKYLYAVDTRGRVVFFDISSSVLSPLIGSFGGDQSKGGSFTRTEGLEISRNGKRLAVADQGQKRIVVFDLTDLQQLLE